MSILDDLLQYEDPSMQGTPLKVLPGLSYDPLKSKHLRYHRTKAGLYIVLKHEADGSLQQESYIHTDGGVRCSSLVYPELNHQSSYLVDDFSSTSTIVTHNPYSKESSLVKSKTKHGSGVGITHSTDSIDGSIISVQLGSPAWSFTVEKNNNKSTTPYRSNNSPKVEGSANLFGKATFLPNGNKIEALPQIKEEPLDFEATIHNILTLIGSYHPHEKRSEEISETLNSLDVLVYS